jgi:hypothetical protein
MTRDALKKIIKSLTLEVLNEDFNNAAEVESNELTAHLSENDVDKDIKDLEKMLKNPDPSRVKDYGSLDNYKKMLKSKIVRLKKTNESGDVFRDIVKKYASMYRDSELARRDKEDYFKWLQTHQPEKSKKPVDKIKKK